MRKALHTLPDKSPIYIQPLVTARIARLALDIFETIFQNYRIFLE
jgi:hypothetical protein